MMLSNQSHHVRVIPASRPCSWLQIILVVREPLNDALHTVPWVLDVIVIPPQVTNVLQQRVINLVGPQKETLRVLANILQYEHSLRRATAISYKSSSSQAILSVSTDKVQITFFKNFQILVQWLPLSRLVLKYGHSSANNLVCQCCSDDTHIRWKSS